MFDRALINHPGLRAGTIDVGRPGLRAVTIDVGRILDAMLYYGRVSLIVDARTFTGLWVRLGGTGAETLLTHPSLQVELTPEMPAVHNNRAGGFLTHTPITVSLAGRQDKVIKSKETDRILHQLLNNMVEVPLADVSRVVRKLHDTRYDRLIGEEIKTNKMFESLISDLPTMKLFLREWVLSKNGVINEALFDALEIETQRLGHEFMIASNMSLNDIADGVIFEAEWGQILPEVQSYGHNLYLAQARSADVITQDLVARIASARIDIALTRAAKAGAALSAFEQFSFGEARPLGEAFESGAIELKDALRIIDQSRRFREWLDNLPPDADLIKEYHLAISKETALSGFGGSTARFAFFTGGGLLLDIAGAGGAGTAVGVGLSAFDTFVVDKLLKGWRPNVFVENVSDRLRLRH